jgi:hypothetical protein
MVPWLDLLFSSAYCLPSTSKRCIPHLNDQQKQRSSRIKLFGFLDDRVHATRTHHAELVQDETPSLYSGTQQSKVYITPLDRVCPAASFFQGGLALPIKRF